MRNTTGPIFCGPILCGLILAASSLQAQTPQNVLVVVNDNSPVSRSIGEYYAVRRAIPSRNIFHLRTTTDEAIPRSQYDLEIAAAIADYLKKNNLVESVLYIVTTLGVPLKIPGTDGISGDASSVDSELTLLYSDMKGARAPHRRLHPQPVFRAKD